MILRTSILLLLSNISLAFSVSKPLSKTVQYYFSDHFNTLDSAVLLGSSSSTGFMLDSSYKSLLDPLLRKKSENVVWRKIFNEHLFDIQREKYNITIDPMLTSQFGIDTHNGDDLNDVHRGIFVNVGLGSKFRFHTFVFESLYKAESYLDRYTKATRIVPGLGEVKQNVGPFGFNGLFSQGALEYSPNEYFDVEFGHGKQFVGDGYRSLFLSDNARSFPYGKLNINIGSKVKFSTTVAEFIHYTPDMINSGNVVRQRKYLSLHNIQFQAHKTLELGAIEGVVWGGDSTGRSNLDWNYLNPFATIRPLEFGLGSPDNMMVGGYLKWKPVRWSTLYGQLLLTELIRSELFNGSNWWGNKYAMQGGVKFHNFKNIPNLFLQLEGNLVRPYTYNHRQAMTSFSHAGQAIAHPSGGNLKEGVFIGNWRKNRFNVNLKSIYRISGLELNDSTSVGSDVLRSYYDRIADYGVVIGQGIPYQQFHNTVTLSYIINPASLLTFDISWTNRYEIIDNATQQNNLLFLGLRTNISNFYYDF